MFYGNSRTDLGQGSSLLVPTLRVGTPSPDAPRRLTTQSVAEAGSHAERGNQSATTAGLS